MDYYLISLADAFVDLYTRTQKQLAETIWTIERIKPMSQKEVEEFQGKTVKKGLLMKDLQRELKERKENLKVVLELIKKHGG
jgi:hypothetical protein